MAQAAAVQAQGSYSLDQLFLPRHDAPVAQVKAIRRALKRARFATIRKRNPLVALKSLLRAIVLQDRQRFAAGPALQIILQAGQRLLEQKEHSAAALQLALNTPEPFADMAGVALLRCRALIRTGQRDAAVIEADRLLALLPGNDARDRTIVALMKAHGLHPRLRARLSLHDLIWGPPGATAIQTLESLDLSTYSAFFDDQLLQYLLELRGAPDQEKQALRKALSWGVAAGHYRRFLAGALNENRNRRHGDRREVPGLNPDYLKSCRRLTESRPSHVLERLVAQGRSVVLLQSHSGARGVISQSLATLNCPLSLVGKGARAVRNRPGDYNMTTGTAIDLPLQFLKLTKLARQGQRLIRLFPDGSDGSEFAEIDLFGRKVPIGLGGATLALHGKAVLAFARTRWTGEGWAVDVEIGPDLAQVANRAEAERLLLEFYAANLRRILLGPAEDIGGVAGYLVSLKRGHP